MQDRNETGAGHKPSLVLAAHLTRRGIAVPRADDRGWGGPPEEVMEAGAFGYLLKPFRLEELDELVERAQICHETMGASSGAPIRV